ncbi:MAG: DNA polymerase III subunit delta [Alistipes sp.]|nr:DNA polymerase III subunit delta [Alistipes sp.]
MAKSSRKFKDCDTDFRAICADIDARRFAPIYLLMGDEPYFIDVLTEKLSTSILNETERAFNQIMIYGRDTDGGTVASYCRQVPMMGGYTVIIVKEAQAMPQLEQLSAYTSNPLQSTILVVCHKEKSADKRQSLYKSVLANGVVFESVRPRDYEIKDWLGSFVRQKGLEIDPSCIELLINHLGTDISRIGNELNKLLVSLPENNRRITAVEIETYIGISKEFNNFELCRAVALKDMKRAMTIADHLSRNPKEYPLLLTIMALFGTFREIFIVNYLRWLQSRKGVPFPTDQELLGHLKSSNIYALRDIKQYSQLWPNTKVFNILGLLREYDGKSKGIDTGGKSDAELLRELLLKIFIE